MSDRRILAAIETLRVKGVSDSTILDMVQAMLGVDPEVATSVVPVMLRDETAERKRAADRERMKAKRDVSRDIARQSRDVGDNPAPLVPPPPPAPPSPPYNPPTLDAPDGACEIFSTPNARREAVDEAFARFWRAYPRRDGQNPKQPAALKFQGHVRRGTDPEAIIAGAMAYAASVAGEDPRFTAQAVTWLNQRRWEDQHHRSPPHVRLDPVQAALQDRIDRIEAREGDHRGARPGGRDLHLDLADDSLEVGL